MERLISVGENEEGLVSGQINKKNLKEWLKWRMDQYPAETPQHRMEIGIKAELQRAINIALEEAMIVMRKL